ncbi:MAG TPA: hypothetical protein VED41_08440, partial [Solirubrobacteraceae bacterium]|nr:hypothetical protein [Solirubrobacteraceae bacterium]
MSDLPQQTDPDLHAIFGMDAPAATGIDEGQPVISVERAGTQAGLAPLGEQDAEMGLGPLANGVDVQLEPDTQERGFAEPAPESARPEQAKDYNGVTKPARRGSSQRFLTDVIVEMELASRRQVDDAIASSRVSGTTPERVLIEQGVLTQDALARALAERYGLDHIDLGVFAVDMNAANLVSTT